MKKVILFVAVICFVLFMQTPSFADILFPDNEWYGFSVDLDGNLTPEYEFNVPTGGAWIDIGITGPSILASL